MAVYESLDEADALLRGGEPEAALEILEVAYPAVAADDELLAAAFDESAAGDAVARCHGGGQLGQIEVVAVEGRRIDDHVVLAHVAAEAVDAGGAGRGAQDRPQHPVLQAAQLHQVARLALEGVLEDLAEAGGDRPEVRLDARRQLLACREHALHHHLAGEVDVGAVLEDHGDHRQAELRERTHLDRAGQAGARLLDGIGHQLLDLERREGRRLGDHRHLDVGDVGEGVDRQAEEGPHAGTDEQQREQDDHQAVADREVDQALHVAARVTVRPRQGVAEPT